MILTIRLDTESAGFREVPSGTEVARILRFIADDCDDTDLQPGAVGLLDRMGNSAGLLSLRTVDRHYLYETHGGR